MNLAFVCRTQNNVTYSRAELTPLERSDFEKTLKGSDESLDSFLYVDWPARIPNMDTEGWDQLMAFLSQNRKASEAFGAIASWIRLREMVNPPGQRTS